MAAMRYETQGFASASDGTPLFYGISGHAGGPALVLNDGIGCDGFAWNYLQPSLAERFRVVHWHYRGHGRSGAPADRARLAIGDLADDALRVMDAASVDTAVHLGHSMGTQVALEIYRRAPARTRGLVLMCGSYGKVTHTFHGSDLLKDVLPVLVQAVRDNRSMAWALWGRIPAGLAYRVARLSKEVDALAIREEDFRQYWEHVGHMDPNVFLEMLRLAGEHSAEDVLPQVASPTLVIAAERDTFTPPQLAAHMAETIPDAEHFLVRGGSHAAPAEQPGVILARILDFLERRVFGDSPRQAGLAGD